MVFIVVTRPPYACNYRSLCQEHGKWDAPQNTILCPAIKLPLHHWRTAKPAYRDSLLNAYLPSGSFRLKVSTRDQLIGHRQLRSRLGYLVCPTAEFKQSNAVFIFYFCVTSDKCKRVTHVNGIVLRHRDVHAPAARGRRPVALPEQRTDGVVPGLPPIAPDDADRTVSLLFGGAANVAFAPRTVASGRLQARLSGLCAESGDRDRRTPGAGDAVPVAADHGVGQRDVVARRRRQHVAPGRSDDQAGAGEEPLRVDQEEQLSTATPTRQNPHKGQVPSCIHRSPEDRAGEGVHVQQQIHNDQKKIGAGRQSGPVGTTNQNLVPKPEGKRKKAKQEEERRKASDRRHQHDATVPTQPNDPASRHASDGHDE